MSFFFRVTKVTRAANETLYARWSEAQEVTISVTSPTVTGTNPTVDAYGHTYYTCSWTDSVIYTVPAGCTHCEVISGASNTCLVYSQSGRKTMSTGTSFSVTPGETCYVYLQWYPYSTSSSVSKSFTLKYW